MFISIGVSCYQIIPIYLWCQFSSYVEYETGNIYSQVFRLFLIVLQVRGGRRGLPVLRVRHGSEAPSSHDHGVCTLAQRIGRYSTHVLPESHSGNKKFILWLMNWQAQFKYSGDLNNGLVQYSNGQKQSNFWLIRYSDHHFNIDWIRQLKNGVFVPSIRHLRNTSILYSDFHWAQYGPLGARRKA